jgi:hypothetical protein
LSVSTNRLAAAGAIGVLVGVGDAADHVFAESDLRVHRSTLGQRLSRFQVDQVSRQLGRADVDCQPQQPAVRR